ncbi:MAG: heavy-metal-associated domain-containing protein [Methylococcaceae bacterium]
MNNTISSNKFIHFEIIQEIKQQLCIKAPCLYQEPERARIFEMLLCKRDAIKSAKASPTAASVDIQFDSEKLSLEKLFILLDTILSNIRRKVSNTIQKAEEVISTQHGLESAFLITGMKCESCAISLEMAINRHPKINRARVDYKTATLKVRGIFSQQEIVKLVRDTGFEPVVLFT